MAGNLLWLDILMGEILIVEGGEMILGQRRGRQGRKGNEEV
jgi:hypothetical protein